MPKERSINVGPIQLQPRVIVYATIIQIATFALFQAGDGPWTSDRFLSLIAISIGPMVVLALAHSFSEILDHDIRGKLGRSGIRQILESNFQFLYVGLIPIVLAIPISLLDVTANTTVTLIFIVGIASLFAWGAVAARLAGRTLIGQLIFGVSYGLLGCIIVGLELLFRH
jgi:hypothetical protein